MCVACVLVVLWLGILCLTSVHEAFTASLSSDDSLPDSTLKPLPLTLFRSPTFSKYVFHHASLPSQEALAGVGPYYDIEHPAAAFADDELLATAM